MKPLSHKQQAVYAFFNLTQIAYPSLNIQRRPDGSSTQTVIVWVAHRAMLRTAGSLFTFFYLPTSAQ